MLQRSQACRPLQGAHSEEHKMVLFSNGYLYSVESELFSLVPTDWTRGVPTYVLTAKIYSPPLQAGVALTPPEVRALCRHKSQDSPDHPPSDLVSSRFDFPRKIEVKDSTAAAQEIARITSFSRNDFGFVAGAMSAYYTVEAT